MYTQDTQCKRRSAEKSLQAQRYVKECIQSRESFGLQLSWYNIHYFAGMHTVRWKFQVLVVLGIRIVKEKLRVLSVSGMHTAKQGHHESVALGVAYYLIVLAGSGMEDMAPEELAHTDTIFMQKLYRDGYDPGGPGQFGEQTYDPEDVYMEEDFFEDNAYDQEMFEDEEPECPTDVAGLEDLDSSQPSQWPKKYKTSVFMKDLLLDEADELNLEYRNDARFSKFFSMFLQAAASSKLIELRLRILFLFANCLRLGHCKNSFDVLSVLTCLPLSKEYIIIVDTQPAALIVSEVSWSHETTLLLIDLYRQLRNKVGSLQIKNMKKLELLKKRMLLLDVTLPSLKWKIAGDY
nr:unnamed protein product [Callosobruchus analis]